MKLLFDYLSIICFFVAFKIWGIYTATGVAIGVLLIQVIAYAIIKKRVERVHLINLTLLVVLGGSTLLFHNDMFIKWKPSVVYWVFSLVLVGSQCFAKQPLIKRLFNDKIELPSPIWTQLNLAWALFFFVMGFLNVYVIYHYSTSDWVNFKLFGTLGLILVFGIAQSLYISKYIPKEAADS